MISFPTWYLLSRLMLVHLFHFSVIVALRNCLVINHTPVTKIKNKTKKFIKLERQETLPVTMTMTLTFSVWKSVDWGPVPNRRSIKPSGIINTFFPLRVQNRVPGILFLGWTPFWLAADQEYPQVVYFWSQPQLHQDTSSLHTNTECNKTDQLIDTIGSFNLKCKRTVPTL